MSEEYGARVKIGGLWGHKTKNGQVFFTGGLGAYSQIQIWPNQKRPGKKDPDFNIFICEQKKRESTDSSIGNYVQDLNNSSFGSHPPIDESRATESDLPF